MNTRDRIKVSIGIILLISMIGNASASDEDMDVYIVGTNIHTDVWGLLTNGGGHYYILRYHPPGTLSCNTLPYTNDCKLQLEATTFPSPGFPDGTISSSYIHFSNISSPHTDANDFYDENFTPTENGMWIVSLWHSGSGTDGVEELIQSSKINADVHVTPEFPTIALPIVAILGIMFILQSRRRKED